MARPTVRCASRKAGKKDPKSSNKQDTTKKMEPSPRIFPYHSFTTQETAFLRVNLLSWYDRCKRDLPWRKLASTESDMDCRAYAVWVSEVMLQQTQVSTVIDYYNKWMKTWPTIQHLAQASLEEVNEKWSGLGYYSRGRRLHEGAQKVVLELAGQIPRTAEDLQRHLPGVGRYTAGAIASISYGQVTGVVDGNVIRVLCRLRCIGADFTTPLVSDALWSLANNLVDPKRPGDFNQAMMELGATICTPKKPLCSECPLQSLCRVYKKVEQDSTSVLNKFVRRSADTPPAVTPDIEECASCCPLCLPSRDSWDSNLGVANLPRKSAKKASRLEQTLTCVVERRSKLGEIEYLLVQRPKTGLLAGMWEFPSMLLEKDCTEKERADIICHRVQEVTSHKTPGKKLQYVGEVVHIFSHINQTYLVYFLSVGRTEFLSIKEEESDQPAYRWVTHKQFLDAAVPTAMKKILNLCEGKTALPGVSETNKKRKRNDDKQVATRKIKSEPDNQRTIKSFFTPISKK